MFLVTFEELILDTPKKKKKMMDFILEFIIICRELLIC